MLRVVDDDDALARTGADRLAALIEDAVSHRGRAIVSLTGGSTPRKLYAALARAGDSIRWKDVHLFWGDERAVPPDHQDSNYGMAHDALIAHVPVPPSQVHRMRGELPPDEAAAEYEQHLMGTFDVMLLGLGEDAHIASIFPRSPLIHERQRRVTSIWAPHLQAYRITLTPPALIDARRIVLVVAGAAKAEAVKAALEAPDDAGRWPVHLLRPAADRVEWLIDRAAARALASPPA